MSSFPPPKLQYKLAVIDLQKHRLARIALWRSGLLIGCLLGLLWLSSSPWWQITRRSQIKIEGQKLVSPATIYQALNFSYPQLIWKLDETSLTEKVASFPAVQAVKIDKQIIPPQVTILLQERTPVALATFQGKVGFLDFRGVWVDRQFYTALNEKFVLPKLVVLNYQPRYQSTWNILYNLISLYPELEINEVHWNHTGNLFLETKIGRVALGSNLSRLEAQFEIMLKLQNLPEHIDRHKIAYIDLSKSEINLIQKY